MTRKDSMVLGSVCLVAGAVFATATPTQANVLFFTSEGKFNAALEKKGKILKGIENYPWTAANGSVLGIDDPLDVNTAVAGWIKPGILLDNVTYQSNLDPQGLNGPNPRGPVGLALFTTGFLGATSNGLVANHFVDSLDILSGPPAGDNHTAMALRVVSFNNSPNGSAVVVTVFDKDDNLIGKTPPFVAPANGGTFLGIITQGEKTIGRVNIYDTNPGFDAEGLYQLAVYVAGEACPKDVEVVIESCDEPPFKVLGTTRGAGNDSSCRDSEDFIISFDILEEGNYTFDLTTNVDPCEWDSYMYLTAGDPCTCTDVVAFNDDCPGIGCFGLSCIGPVNLGPGDYWIVVEGFSAADAGPVDLHVTSACKCPWDLDGDGNVGVGDLLILLANWSNPYDVADLLRMLAAWGPC